MAVGGQWCAPWRSMSRAAPSVRERLSLRNLGHPPRAALWYLDPSTTTLPCFLICKHHPAVRIADGLGLPACLCGRPHCGRILEYRPGSDAARP